MAEPGTESPVIRGGTRPIITTPPFFLARFLFDGDSYALHEFAKERIHVLGPAWGCEVLGMLNGNPKECDDVYQNQRTEARARVDSELARQWEDLVRDHGSEKNLILAQTAKLIQLLDLPTSDLPCVALETRVSSRQFSILRISARWLDNNESRRTLSAALQSGLSPTIVRKLVGAEPITTEEMTSRMQDHLKNVHDTISRGMRGIKNAPLRVVEMQTVQRAMTKRALVVDRSRNQAFLRQRPIKTTDLTFRLLVLLAETAENGGGWVSRDEAEETVWRGAECSFGAVDSAFGRLREALRRAGRKQGRDGNDLVETKRRAGHRLRLSRKDVCVI